MQRHELQGGEMLSWFVLSEWQSPMFRLHSDACRFANQGRSNQQPDSLAESDTQNRRHLRLVQQVYPNAIALMGHAEHPGTVQSDSSHARICIAPTTSR